MSATVTARTDYAIVPSAATRTGLGNYIITYVNGTLTVNPATLTITANNASKTYGTLKSFSATAFTGIGLVTANGDTITGVTETSTGAPVSATVTAPGRTTRSFPAPRAGLVWATTSSPTSTAHSRSTPRR